MHSIVRLLKLQIPLSLSIHPNTPCRSIINTATSVDVYLIHLVRHPNAVVFREAQEDNARYQSAFPYSKRGLKQRFIGMFGTSVSYIVIELVLELFARAL